MSEFIPNSYQTPNAYVDQYMHLLTPEEWKTLCYAVRRIFGFNKRQDRISLSQFMNGLVSGGKQLDYGTGLCEGAQRKALDGLKEHNLLIEVSPNDPRENEGALYELQLNSKKVEKGKLETRWQTKKAKDSLRTKKASIAIAEIRKNKDPLSSDDTTPDDDTPYRRTIPPPLSSDDDTISSRKTVEKQVVVNTMVNTHAENEIEKPVVVTAADFFTEPLAVYQEFFHDEKLTPQDIVLINSIENLEAWREACQLWLERGYAGNHIDKLYNRYTKIVARMKLAQGSPPPQDSLTQRIKETSDQLYQEQDSTKRQELGRTLLGLKQKQARESQFSRGYAA